MLCQRLGILAHAQITLNSHRAGRKVGIMGNFLLSSLKLAL